VVEVEVMYLLHPVQLLVRVLQLEVPVEVEPEVITTQQPQEEHLSLEKLERLILEAVVDQPAVIPI
tara:strand:+ start:356 stop:553 length:198 start_codon:yes stop_codon:yes gene_type:complete